jgi:putative Holliday junction resolvase
VQSRKCLAGVDFGTKRIGLAISDLGRTIAVPLTVYQRRNATADAEFFRSLAQKYAIGMWVLGLPRHLAGEEMRLARQVRSFGAWLAAQTQLPVTYWDERLTTAEAERLLSEAQVKSRHRREKLDKLAAQVLLQSYLDAGCPPASPS